MKYDYVLGITESRFDRLRQRWWHLRRTVRWLLVAGIVLVAAGSVATALLLHSSPDPRLQPPTQTPVITPAPSARLGRYGFAVGDTLLGLPPAKLNAELAGIAASGVTWIRIDISWADVQPQAPKQYAWAGLDQVVVAAKQHNLQVLGTLAYTPAWARPAGCDSQQCAPASPAAFAAFVAAAAGRYAPQGVHTWEIWNEPNLAGFWSPSPDPTAYAQLLKLSYTTIKGIDPQAVVVSGGLGALDDSSASINQVVFLAKLYAVGAKPYFDVVGFHPYSFPALPSYTASWSSWSMMAALPQSIRSVMTANGDDAKQVWITEFGAPTGGPGAIATPGNPNYGLHPDHVSSALQSEMVTQALDAYKSSSWIGALMWYTYQDSGTATSTNENFFGLLNYSGTPKPAFATFKQAVTQAQRQQ